nr:O-methyltransferase [uncultured Sellimonas sp.]
MIVEERIVDYIRSLETRNNEILETIEQEALKERVPIIRKEMQSFLKVLLLLKRPKRILEIGAAVGFSAILMSEYAGDDCRIDTIENYEKRIQKARENIKMAGKEKQIHLLCGDAMEMLKTLEEPYDMIFVDAAKAQYIAYFPEVMRLLKKEGMLISDNVLQDGGIMESRFAVERRDRTIHSRMREYLYLLKHDDRLETAVVPIGDGASVSIKKE